MKKIIFFGGNRLKENGPFSLLAEYFIKQKIKEYEKSGFLSLVNNKIQVTTLGRYFVRHICQIFDTFIDEESEYKVHGN